MVLAGSLVALFAVGVPASAANASELLNKAPWGAEQGLSDPATSKRRSFDDLGQDWGDLALFQKAPMVPPAPSLGHGSTRCSSWWLPPELPLGGGFSFALFCNGQALGGQGNSAWPDHAINES